jgi:hypothetical protein
VLDLVGIPVHLSNKSANGGTVEHIQDARDKIDDNIREIRTRVAS